MLLLAGALLAGQVNSVSEVPMFVYALPPLVPLIPWLIPSWRDSQKSGGTAPIV
jgi:hypothetical protein